MLKRIWAVVSESDFYAFQQRAKQDGMDMGQALAAVTHTYAIGHEVTIANVKKHHDQLDCIKAHEDSNPHVPHLKDVQG